MKKREITKQKQKLKKQDSFKMVKLAQFMCIALILLFLVYLSLIGINYKGGFNALLAENLFTTVGFIVCTLNLYVFYAIKRLRNNMETYQCIEATKIEMLFITIAQLALFNYASAGLLVYSLVKYFKWSPFKIKNIVSEISKTKKWPTLIVTFIILASLILLAYVIINAALYQ